MTILASPLSAANYTFTKIVDNTPATSPGKFYMPAGPVLINNNGTVVFHASYQNAKSDTVYGMYTGSGSAIGTILEDFSRNFFATGINDSGTVVYFQGAQIYTDTAGAAPFLVLDGRASNPSNLSFLVSYAYPAINNSGTVAVAVLDTSTPNSIGAGTIVARTGSGSLQTIVSGTELPRSNAQIPALIYGTTMNNSGAVAFFASQVSGVTCQCGTFVKSNGTLTSLAPFWTAGTTPQINDIGAVAFEGNYQGTNGVFVASGGKIAAAVDFTGKIVSLGRKNFSFNNKNQVAYYGVFNLNVQGIFTGPDYIADRVIATGDPLFGSVVSSIDGDNLYQGRFMNDSGQIVFAYKLSNGLSGIAVATPVASNTPPPTIAANGIFNGASFTNDAVSPGSVASIFGANFIGQLTVPSSYPLPASVNGVTVTFNGIPAPLFFVAPGQINAQVPFGVSGPNVSVQVSTPVGPSAAQNIKLVPQSPSIFTANQSGVGQGVVVFGNTVTIVGPVTPGTDWRPAHAGDAVTIYANGLGAVTPPVSDGYNSCDKSVCAPDFSNLTLRYTAVRPVVQIGGVTVPDAAIQFAGLAPQFVGLYQINLTIPSGITPGSNVPVVIQMGNTASAANVHIAIQ